MVLAEKFLELTHRRYPVAILPSEDDDVISVLTGDPDRLHDKVYSDTKFAEIFRRRRPDHVFCKRISVSWHLYPISSMCASRRGEGASSESRPMPPSGMTSIPSRNASWNWHHLHKWSSPQLLLEAELWNQQGRSAAPVIFPRNVIALDVEFGITFRRNNLQPAFTMNLIMGEDHQRVQGIYQLFRSLYCDSNSVQIPFNSVCPNPTQEWNGHPIIVRREDLARCDRLSVANDRRVIQAFATGSRS